MSIVALFDMSGYSVHDWAIAGETCYCLDIKNLARREDFPSGGSIEYLAWDAFDEKAAAAVLALGPRFMYSFPPCTDLTVAGAKHFEGKYAKDKSYLASALALVFLGPQIAREAKCAVVVENPKGVLSTQWRKPDRIFDPCDFGGYLPHGSCHPDWPQYIEANDRYLKGTCVWVDGEGEVLWPRNASVPYITNELGFSKQMSSLGGKSERTKEIRSMTPRGWARAMFEANYTNVTGRELPK